MKTWGPRLVLLTALLVWVVPALGMVFLGLHTAVSHDHDHDQVVAAHGHDHAHDGQTHAGHTHSGHSHHGEQHDHDAAHECRFGHAHAGTFERLAEILSHGHSHDDATPEHEHPLRTDTPAPSSKLSLGLPIAVVSPDEVWLAAGLSGRLEAPPARRLLKVPIFRLSCALLI